MLFGGVVAFWGFVSVLQVAGAFFVGVAFTAFALDGLATLVSLFSTAFKSISNFLLIAVMSFLIAVNSLLIVIRNFLSVWY